jgi:hypothetical protein
MTIQRLYAEGLVVMAVLMLLAAIALNTLQIAGAS